MRGVAYLVICCVLAVLFISAAGGATLFPAGPGACHPGCFINLTYVATANISGINLTHNTVPGISYTDSILINGSLVPFTDGTFNVTASQSYTLQSEIANAGGINATLTFNLSGTANMTNVTGVTNLAYYVNQTQKQNNRVTNLRILQGGSAITDPSSASGDITLEISAAISDFLYTNITRSSVLLIQDINISLFNFSSYIKYSDADAAILSQAAGIDSFPANIISVNTSTVFPAGAHPMTLTVNTKGTEMDAYIYSAGSLTKLENPVGGDKIVIGSSSSMVVKQNLTYPVLLASFGIGPRIISKSVSDWTVHEGQTVFISIVVNDTDTAYVAADEQFLTQQNMTWSGNISVRTTPASIYIVDDRDHYLYEESLNFSFDNTAPSLQVTEPASKIYVTNLILAGWTAADTHLNRTYLLIDDGRYSARSGGTLEDGKIIYLVNHSGSLSFPSVSCGHHTLKTVSADTHENIRTRENPFFVAVVCNTSPFVSTVMGFDIMDYYTYTNQTYFDNNTNQTLSLNLTFADYRAAKGLYHLINWSLNTSENISLFHDEASVITPVHLTLYLNDTAYASSIPQTEVVSMSFHGLNVTWSYPFAINTSKPGLASALATTLNVTVQDMFFVEDQDAFFSRAGTSAFNVTFPYSISGKKVLYYPNESSVFPLLLPDERIHSSGSTLTLELKDIYGVVIVNNHSNLQLSFPMSSMAAQLDSNVTFEGSLLNLFSPGELDCSYGIKNFKQINSFSEVGGVALAGTINQSFSFSLAGLKNDNYRLNITCATPPASPSTLLFYDFSLSDKTPPKITSVRNVGPDRIAPYAFEDTSAFTLETPSLTLYTSENATCAYATQPVPFDNMESFEVTGSDKHTLNLLLEFANYTLFVRCKDQHENAMIIPKVIRYTILGKYVPPPSSIPVVGEGTHLNPLLGSGNHTRSWQLISKNSILTVNIDDTSTSFEQMKLTITERITGAELSLFISNQSFGQEIDPLYRSLHVSSEKLQDAHISNIIVFFRVSHDWIAEHDVRPEYIALKELGPNGNITTAPTYKLRSNEDYIFFRAEPDHFNTYFISTDASIDQLLSLQVKESDVDNRPVIGAIKDEGPVLEDNTITVHRKSYAVTITLIIIFSVLIAVILVSRQINAVPSQDLGQLSKEKQNLEMIKNALAETKKESSEDQDS